MGQPLKKIVNIHQAKSELSQLIQDVRAGESVIIANAGKPVAKLVPLRTKRNSRKPGTAKDEIAIGSDFNDPLPKNFLKDYFS